MNKADLIREVARRRRAPRRMTAVIVNEMIAALGRALSDGREVHLRRFGAFRMRPRRSRAMRNPRTGDSYRVPAKLVPVFRSSRALRGMLAEQRGTAPGPRGEEGIEGHV